MRNCTDLGRLPRTVPGFAHGRLGGRTRVGLVRTDPASVRTGEEREQRRPRAGPLERRVNTLPTTVFTRSAPDRAGGRSRRRCARRRSELDSGPSGCIRPTLRRVPTLETNMAGFLALARQRGGLLAAREPPDATEGREHVRASDRDAGSLSKSRPRFCNARAIVGHPARNGQTLS